MIDHWGVPLVQLNALCERAVRYRRSQITDPRADRVRGIRHSIPSRDLEPDAEGWVTIAALIDEIEYRDAAIRWHPETDRIRIVYDPPRRSQFLDRPWYRSYQDPEHGPFYCLDGYVYSFDGVDYDHEAAALMMTLDRSDAGWTWRKEPRRPRRERSRAPVWPDTPIPGRPQD